MEADLTVTRRGACAGCGSPDLRLALDLGESPLADRFPASAGEPELAYPLQMAVCGHCWLAQLLHVVPDEVLFGADYAFSTGASPAAVRYFAAAAASIAALSLPRSAVDVACNDGTFLKALRAVVPACRVLGVDPAEPAAQAVEAGVPVIREPLTETVAALIRDEHGPADLVTAFNVAAHVADPAAFFRAIRVMLAGEGTAVIEVQDLAELVTGCQFDHVYHEHRSYFSVDTLMHLVSAAGLQVTRCQRTAAQGGSLRITAVPSAACPGSEPRELWLRNHATYAALQDRAGYARRQLRDLLEDFAVSGVTAAGYAASAKSATLLNFCGIGPDLLPWIDDLTPAKAGRFTPGTRIPVVKQGERGAPEVWLLLARNYLAAVLDREQDWFTRGGRLVVPLPSPAVLSAVLPGCCCRWQGPACCYASPLDMASPPGDTRA